MGSISQDTTNTSSYAREDNSLLGGSSSYYNSRWADKLDSRNLILYTKTTTGAYFLLLRTYEDCSSSRQAIFQRYVHKSSESILQDLGFSNALESLKKSTQDPLVIECQKFDKVYEIVGDLDSNQLGSSTPFTHNTTLQPSSIQSLKAFINKNTVNNA